MMYSTSGIQPEDDSVSMSISNNEMLNEKLESSLSSSNSPGVGTDIRKSDVLCGRGKTSFNHSGNKWFRDAVSGSMEEYIKAENRFEKSLVVHNIMDRVKKEGGRFLKKDHSSGKWVELSEPQAKEKVGHAVRDAVNALEGRKKKHKRSATDVDGRLDDSPRTQQVRNVQSVLASISSAAAEYGQGRTDFPPRPPYSYNDMTSSNILPQLQSLRSSYSGGLDLYGYNETDYSRAPMSTQIGHASWSGNPTNDHAPPPTNAPVRHRSLPLGASDHGHSSSLDYYQSEQILRRHALDPMGVEQQQQHNTYDAQQQQHYPNAVHSQSGAAFSRTHMGGSSMYRAANGLPAEQDDNFLDKISSVLGPIHSDYPAAAAAAAAADPYHHGSDTARTTREV